MVPLLARLKEYLLFDPFFQMSTGIRQTGYLHGLVISNAQKTLVLQFKNSALRIRWEEAILRNPIHTATGLHCLLNRVH